MGACSPPAVLLRLAGLSPECAALRISHGRPQFLPPTHPRRLSLNSWNPTQRHRRRGQGAAEAPCLGAEVSRHPQQNLFGS